MLNKNAAALQTRWRRRAWTCACFASAGMILMAAVLLALRLYFQRGGWLGNSLFVLAALDLMMLGPIWALLVSRLRELKALEAEGETELPTENTEN